MSSPITGCELMINEMQSHDDFQHHKQSTDDDDHKPTNPQTLFNGSRASHPWHWALRAKMLYNE